MTVDRKTFLIEEATFAENQFAGYGSVFDYVDDQKESVDHGAFAPVLDEFLKEGFIAWGHDWNVPVAMPVEAIEDKKGLRIVAEFHSTPTAQEKRVITQERMERGLSMGLSIGYHVDDSYKDAQGVKHLKSFDRLYEVSLVTVPANRAAQVAAVKSGNEGSTLPYLDHLDWVTDEMAEVLRRSIERRDLRAKEGRVLSRSNRELLSQARQTIRDLEKVIGDLLDTTEPDGKTAARAALLRHLEVQARLKGVI